MITHPCQFCPPVILTTDKGYYILTDDPNERPHGPIESRDEVKKILIERFNCIEATT